MRSNKIFLFKMGEIITHLCATGKDPVQKENLMVLEISGRVMKQCFLVDQRKWDLMHKCSVCLLC